MNIKIFTLSILFFSLLFANTIAGQTTSQFGTLPSINLNKSLKKSWSVNFKIESRQLFQQKDFEYVQTDLSLIAAKKVGLNSRVAYGHLVRFRGDALIHRMIQQYVIVQKMTNYRLAHRFASDQTFSLNESPEFRFRYRLTSQIPLNGQSADTKELYLKINNELLNKIQSSTYEMEIRIVPLLGYTIRDNSKVEIGLDYRLSSFLTSTKKNNFWMAFNWYIEI